MTVLCREGSRDARFAEFVKTLQEDASGLHAVYRMVLHQGGRYAASL
jgi:hypothetical protein